MKINWKLRFQNKTVLCAIIAQLAAIVYMALGFCSIVPAVTEDVLVGFLFMVVDLLVLVGVVVDPTTSGTNDSAQAMTYETPRK